MGRVPRRLGEIPTGSLMGKQGRSYQQKKDRGAKLRGTQSGPKCEWEFIAVDGEGSTVNGLSVYQLLGAYGRVIGEVSIENKEGLSTYQCLEFLLNLSHRKTKVCICGFSFDYDVNNILSDLPWRKLERLAKDLPVGIYIDGEHRYKIKHIPHKATEIWKMEKKDRKWKTAKYVRVYDVFGFFQTSFLKAIEERKIGSKEQLEVIERYKLRRGENLEDDWEGWKRYNSIECHLLVEMMEQFSGLLESQNIHLSNWWGAGAIAAYWFRQHDIKDHLIQSWDSDIDKWIMRAFFGGQIQRLLVGRFNQPVFRYDICSAYPWGQSQLPSLSGGKWTATDTFQNNCPWALYDIEWDFREHWESMYGPLPWRTRGGSILYPRRGWGIFWQWEVEAVQRCFPGSLKINSGLIFTPSTNTRPFEWIEERFEERNRLKKQGNPQNIPLKLGLNSLYGKTAQKQGMVDNRGNRLKPPYQSYFWAGNITSKTRARMIEAAGSNPNSIIALATDGVYSLSPLELPTGTSLGDWMEEEPLEWFELYGNGIYRGEYVTEAGKRKLLTKARGCLDKEFDFDLFAEEFRNCPPEKIRSMTVPQTVRRFYGYKLSAMRNRPELHCTWGEEKRKASIIGFDCFNAYPHTIPGTYRIECYFENCKEKIKNTSKYEQGYVPQPPDPEEVLLACQPD